MILHDSSWTRYSLSSHRPPRAFYFSIISILIGIPSRSFCGGESVETASLTSNSFCVLVTAKSCGFRVSLLVVWVFFCSNYSSFFCPFSYTFIPLSVQEIIKKIGSFNPWTSIIDFSFPGNHDFLVILAVQFHDVTFITEFLSILACPQTFFVLFFFCSFLNNSTPSEASAREQARSANKERGTIKPSILKISV